MGSPALPQHYRRPGTEGAGFGLRAEHPGKWDSHGSPARLSGVFFIWLEGQHFGPCCSSPSSAGESRKPPLGAVEGRGREGGRPRCPFSLAARGRAPAPGTSGGGARSVTWRRHFLCPCFALKAAAVPPAPRPARGGCGRARRPRLPPTARCPAERRGWLRRGTGQGRLAENSPRLIKRWGPVPAPYK